MKTLHPYFRGNAPLCRPYSIAFSITFYHSIKSFFFNLFMLALALLFTASTLVGKTYYNHWTE